MVLAEEKVEIDDDIDTVDIDSADDDSDYEGDFTDIAGEMDARRKTTEKIPKSLDATQMYLLSLIHI